MDNRRLRHLIESARNVVGEGIAEKALPALGGRVREVERLQARGYGVEAVVPRVLQAGELVEQADVGAEGGLHAGQHHACTEHKCFELGGGQRLDCVVARA
jgi:hypothetical protein